MKSRKIKTAESLEAVTHTHTPIFMYTKEQK